MVLKTGRCNANDRLIFTKFALKRYEKPNVSRVLPLPQWVKATEKSTSEVHSFFYKNLFCGNLRPEICQNIKNMLRTYPRLREKQFIFYCFYFPKSRKSDLHNNVLHGIIVHVNFFSFNTFLLYMVNNIFTLYFYNSLIYDNYNHCLILSIYVA